MYKVFALASVFVASAYAAGPPVVALPHPAPVHAPLPHKPAPLPHKPAPYHPQPVYDDVPKPYSYEYGVSDEYSGTNFNAHEAADGKVVSGSYQVHLPDGRIQTVTYTADHYNGYVADVSYEGHAAYPPAPAPHKPAPYHPAPHKPAPYHVPVAPTYKPAPVVHAAPIVHAPVVPLAPHPAPVAPVHALPPPAPHHV